jgi:hypothetical protein
MPVYLASKKEVGLEAMLQGSQMTFLLVFTCRSAGA